MRAFPWRTCSAWWRWKRSEGVAGVSDGTSIPRFSRLMPDNIGGMLSSRRHLGATLHRRPPSRTDPQHGLRAPSEVTAGPSGRRCCRAAPSAACAAASAAAASSRARTRLASSRMLAQTFCSLFIRHFSDVTFSPTVAERVRSSLRYVPDRRGALPPTGSNLRKRRRHALCSLPRC